MITSTIENDGNTIHIFQKRRLDIPYSHLIERRVIQIGSDWVKTGAWRIA